MRCNQVSIFIERFGEYVPRDYSNEVQRISVYCDDFTSIYAALAKANAMAINELNEHESIGARSYVSTNEYSRADYKEMHGIAPAERHFYKDDLELQFTYKNSELRKDRIWVHENINEIIQLISVVENKKLLKQELKEKFGLKDFQIKKLLSMRLDMLSKDDYVKDIKEQKEMEASRLEGIGWNPAHQIKWNGKRICEEKKKISEYNAYITIAKNYLEIIKIVKDNPKVCDYEDILKEKYGLDRGQAMLIKSVTIDDLISVDKYREEVKKAEEEIERLQNDLEELKLEVHEK